VVQISLRCLGAALVQWGIDGGGEVLSGGFSLRKGGKGIAKNCFIGWIGFISRRPR